MTDQNRRLAEIEAERGYAVARYTGRRTDLGLFEIDGDQMRAAEFEAGCVNKWGYCNRSRLLSPIFPTLAEAREARARHQETTNADE